MNQFIIGLMLLNPWYVMVARWVGVWHVGYHSLSITLRFWCFMQDKVLNFVHNSYHNETGNVNVPASLRMKKEASNRQESAELKAYRTRNRYAIYDCNIIILLRQFLFILDLSFSIMLRHFIGREDCTDVLEWIKRTLREPILSPC